LRAGIAELRRDQTRAIADVRAAPLPRSPDAERRCGYDEPFEKLKDPRSRTAVHWHARATADAVSRSTGSGGDVPDPE
jgi:hypothetical protein